MKILHTSDWHIGKQLHKVDLSEDLELFFDWLVEVIKSKNIELLLVSGDVFDHAYPSQSALKQYYGFLKRMIPSNCKLIITGGNHDSATVLNAPKDLLQHLDIHVIGGSPENMDDLFIEFPEDNVVVAAVPFLKERDIRRSSEGEEYKDRIEQIRIGLSKYFEEVNTIYRRRFKGYKFITMGHLYAQGGTVSDSMRDVQIGNQAGVEHDIFGQEPHYIALGHIHKPYRISKDSPAYYSGSPVALSFSENEDHKQVNIVQTNSRDCTPEILQIPISRKLIQLAGTFSEVCDQLRELTGSSTLQNLVHIRVIEDKEMDLLRVQLEELVQDFNTKQNDFLVVKYEIKFKEKKELDIAMDIDVQELKAIDVFDQKLLKEGVDGQQKILFRQAFLSLLEEMNL